MFGKISIGMMYLQPVHHRNVGSDSSIDVDGKSKSGGNHSNTSDSNIEQPSADASQFPLDNLF